MTEQRFFIPFRLPSMNEIVASRSQWGTGKGKRWNKYSQTKRDIEDSIVAVLHAAKVKPVTGPVWIGFEWVEPDSRRDADNIRAGAKHALDAMVKAGVLPNDNRKWVVGFLGDTFTTDKNGVGVWVTIKE